MSPEDAKHLRELARDYALAQVALSALGSQPIEEHERIRREGYQSMVDLDTFIKGLTV